MTDYIEQRKEEIEVLESIFSEINIDSDDHVILKVEPEDPPPSSNPLIVNLQIKYTERYPDELPEIEITAIEGELTEEERDTTLEKLIQIGNESLGMAMIFSLSMTLQHELSRILADRIAEITRLEKEKMEQIEKAEAIRKQGTPITKETFLAWRAKFHEQNEVEKSKLEDERLKLLTPKEREERKKSSNRMTGRQLFESNTALVAADHSLLFDENAEELDLSLFPTQSLP